MGVEGIPESQLVRRTHVEELVGEVDAVASLGCRSEAEQLLRCEVVHQRYSQQIHGGLSCWFGVGDPYRGFQLRLPLQHKPRCGTCQRFGETSRLPRGDQLGDLPHVILTIVRIVLENRVTIDHEIL